MRTILASALVAIGVAHMLWPTRVALDWATLALLGGAVVLGFAHKIKALLPFVDSIELGKAKVKLRQASQKVAEVVTESENAEILQAEKKSIEAPLEAKNDQLADLVREERLADTSRESKILQIAAVDKFTAILQAGMELEAEVLLLAAMMGLRNRASVGTFREAVDEIHKQGLITSATMSALLDFWALRNTIAHTGYPLEEDDPAIKSSLDSGLRLLRLIRNIPRPIYRVFQADVPLFEDQLCTKRIGDPVGVLLEVTETDGTKPLRIFPAGRKFKAGEIVGWDWDMTRTYGPAYFIHPITSTPTMAWSASAAFIGRNEDLRFQALRG